ncbi:peptidoglycan DD-metalloendopeptidase family protein [Patescibacteria group bacterium]|nr:peptidoglycan DD-metalloendopeptidase family protein [Patescibacteria group bacterium]
MPKLGIKFILILCLAVFTFSAVNFAFAENNSELEAEIANRKSEIEKINNQIDEYKKKINGLTSQTASLLNDISLIENQSALMELQIQATQSDIEAQQLEVQLLQIQIADETTKMENQKDLLEEMLFELHTNEGIGFLQVFFGANNFNDLFQEVQQLETINNDLNKTLNSTKLFKGSLEEKKNEQEQRADDLLSLQDELEFHMATLESQMAAKNMLVKETQSSESKYRVLMSEMRQEQQKVTNELSAFQGELESRLSESDEYTGIAPYISWPLSGIITATFHDPTYPFRHLWEHSGLDIAAPNGTPVKAAAPGIVAWTRTGSSYGNYIMIIHEGGMATLYAHMSAFNVAAEQYVERGQVIGFEGSTGFSTGPHLHFEVRLNGIPVDPQAYLP